MSQINELYNSLDSLRSSEVSQQPFTQEHIDQEEVSRSIEVVPSPPPHHLDTLTNFLLLFLHYQKRLITLLM